MQRLVLFFSRIQGICLIEDEKNWLIVISCELTEIKNTA